MFDRQDNKFKHDVENATTTLIQHLSVQIGILTFKLRTIEQCDIIRHQQFVKD